MRDTIMTTCFTPTTITEAVGILADNPELCVVNGGTDVMVSVNAGSKAIAGWLNLRRVDEIAEIAALIQGNGDAMYITSGGKGIVIGGDDSDALSSAMIYFVNDSLGANVGTIEADDVVLVGTIATFDLDTLTIANFVFA